MTAEPSIRLLSDVLMFDHRYITTWASFVAQLIKNPPAKWETWIPFLGWEDPLGGGGGRLPTPVFWPREIHGLHINNLSELLSMLTI